MFCPHCGTKNLEEAKFCASCGRPLHVEGSDKATTRDGTTTHNDSYSPPSSYHELGGWLAVLTYGLLIAVALIAIGAVLSGFTLIRYAKYLGIGFLFLGLLNIALYIPAVYFGIKMYRMIKERNCMFLRFYEMTMLVLCGISLVFMVVGGLNVYISTSEYVKSMLQSLIVFAIWMTYFTKSVRVRTYFGSDEYLKHSIILNILKKA